MEAEAKEREALASKAQGKAALNHAIAAAEIYMKAARGTSSAAERSRFKKKCEDMISMAERLKVSSRTDSVAAVEKRLKLPRLSRQIPTNERNILLRGSRLHGNLFPPWESDPDPKEFSSPPYIDPSEFSLSERQGEVFAGWKRPLELAMRDTQLDEAQTRGRLMESNGDYDLVQDITTDCSVVASLCACIKHLKPGPTSILPALMSPIDFEMGQPEISASGKYVFRMYFNGCFRKVTIDDRLPSSSNDRTLYVVDRQNRYLLWPALVEKAYLKVRGGYDFPGSNSGTDLWVLTGWIPQQIFLQSDDVDGDQTWRRVKKAYDYGDVVVTLGTGRLSPDEEEILGLAGEHDYAVLDISEDASGNKKMLVKNPWCDGLVWKGVGSSAETSRPPSPFSSSSEQQKQQQQQQQRPVKLKPGTFWISFEDVAQNFESLYLNWNPSLFTERQDHHFAWELPEPNMVHSFAHNPQYSMTAQADGSVWILLSRHFQDAELDIARGGGGGGSHSNDSSGNSSVSNGSSSNGGRSTTLASVSNKLGFMSLYIFASPSSPSPSNNNLDSERILLPDDRSVVYRGPFVDSPQTLAPFEARKGTRYTVVVASQDLPLPQYAFTLSFFSRSALAVHKIGGASSSSPSSSSSTTPQHHVTEISSAWTRRTAGGNAASPTYGANPQFRLRLPTSSSPSPSSNPQPQPQPQPLTILLSTSDPSLPIRVDLVWANGKRVAGPVPQRDLVASSGEYRRGGCVVARCCPEPEPAGGGGVYTIVCSTFDPGQLGGFTLRVSSSGSTAGGPCVLEPIAPDAAGRLRVRQYQHQPRRQRRNPAIRIRLVYGSGPNRTILAATGYNETDEDDSRSSSGGVGGVGGGGGGGGGEFREVGPGGLRTPEFDVEPRRGVLWLVAEQIGGDGGGGGGEGGDVGEDGLQVEILCDAPVQVGAWEVVDV
ncbi:putative palb protein [Eutypa lata UCREL1]|uniref:Putative palb protein n=1 Tax=Eutypa lata (strain UCR-EL1) TaxID=1287681 RepID=M7SY07_EUTLA|nr:putative palb protein [Eutypa lata UCREL1]